MNPSETTREYAGEADHPEEPADEGPLPRLFGKYELRHRLGHGGMAVVYQAIDRTRQCHCAIKIPKPCYRTGDSRAQFDEEARALQNLNLKPHPNICGLHAVGEVDGVPFLEMPLIPGEALSKFLEPNGRLTHANAVELVHTLAITMQHAHDCGVIHRDLKPANVIITREAEPVIVDFGLALALTDPDARLDRRLGGSRDHIPPEVIRAVFDRTEPPVPRPDWDVYALGVILYELLTGRLPWPSQPDLREHLAGRLAAYPLSFPSQQQADFPECLAQVCLRALARDPRDRYEGMQNFARELAQALSHRIPGSNTRPARVAHDRFRYEFVRTGTTAPDPCPADQLYLDVGNRLAPGVIDHHRLLAYSGSTTRLVHSYPELLETTLERLPPGAALTICLHEWPDLDSVAAAYLTGEYLVNGCFPARTPELVRYVDWVDRGALGVTRDTPYSLYAAFQVLVSRSGAADRVARWTADVVDGLRLLRYVLQDATEKRRALTAVHALACPGLFGLEDREATERDLRRYEDRLADPTCRARQVRLRLPDLYGERTEVDMLLVRDVQNAGDPNRCLYFKDWARTDAQRCPRTKGFIALSVFHSEGGDQRRRCIISLRPGSDHRATFRGLGALLDAAESHKRRRLNFEKYGKNVDDRQFDPISGAPKTPRPGYDNADPWYDGRSHGGGFTIVDSPAEGTGTLLTEDEIVEVILAFGHARESDVRPIQPRVC